MIFSLTLINTGIRITQGFKDGANGAVKIAVNVLGVVASTTQNVPYLGIISGALTEFIKIKDVLYVHNKGEIFSIKSSFFEISTYAFEVTRVRLVAQ
jgi:hypothetical protein